MGGVRVPGAADPIGPIVWARCPTGVASDRFHGLTGAALLSLSWMKARTPQDMTAEHQTTVPFAYPATRLVHKRRDENRDPVGRSFRSDNGPRMTADLLCMGEPMLEFNQLPLQPDGARHYLEGHGGDTSNAAVAAARHGAPDGIKVGMITALGHDMPGDSFMALWAREEIDTSTVTRTDRYLTGVYFVTHDEAGHHFLHYRANSAAAMFGPEDVPVRAIGRARMLYLSGISQGISTTACDATLGRDRRRAPAWGESRLRHQLSPSAVATGARRGGHARDDRDRRLRVAGD